MKCALASLLFVVLAAACSHEEAHPSPGSKLSDLEARLRIVETLGSKVAVCGPPVVGSTPVDTTDQQLAALRRDRKTFRTLLRHLGLGEDAAHLTHAQARRAVHLWQQAEVIEIRREGGVTVFHAYVDSATGERRVSGLVDAGGGVIVQRSTPDKQNCPI